MEPLLFKTYYESPCGLIEVCASDVGISSILFVNNKVGESIGSNIVSDCVTQLDEYFKKQRKIFSIPLDFQGTDFQKRVWTELLKIPFGKTISYLQLAIRLGDKKSIRAVGGANGKNPISIIVPCHRVIGTNGDLVGYSGGLDKKKWLLAHEGASVQQELFA
jgi:methylated-DNA-[protein]-cysteine S-methyltransferase